MAWCKTSTYAGLKNLNFYGANDLVCMGVLQLRHEAEGLAIVSVSKVVYNHFFSCRVQNSANIVRRKFRLKVMS